MISIYKPTPRNTGCAISFQASNQNKHLYVSLIRQHSWDANRKLGSFISNKNVPNMSTTLKFHQAEAGAMIDAIERWYEFSAYHGSENKATRISFGPAEGEDSSTMVFKVNQNDTEDTTQKSSFFIPISLGEARLIKEYLIHYLHKSFRQLPDKQGASSASSSEEQGGLDGDSQPSASTKNGASSEKSGSDW